MNIKKLREVIANLPDDTLVVTSGSDHSYQVSDATPTTALYAGKGEISEDFGEEDTPEAEYGKRIHVLLVQ